MRIDAFAAATEDRQWIHVDPERAARGPLGGTVAHGFLLLSLVPFFNLQNEVFMGRFRMAVNYGLDRVRFPHSVRTGSRVRNRAVLKKIEKRGFRKVLDTVENTMEIEGVGKPAMVIGNIHADDPITNAALRAQYCSGTDAYSDTECRARDALPICGGGCANLRLRARHFGEAGLEYCSPYREHLIPCLEAYYDSFRTREIWPRSSGRAPLLP